ncbi:PepSY domain-containing protein [Candidatus Dactylopiibacterium carminicum]|uniref:PepSY domain-containing protein n=1 Tax=Candidatus Dactylopiibacterium carminicum TaxID=857335 RepID=UPI001140E5A6|nr:hypothetical protein [Candidatus Dactylopiibacterium carminicum]
MSGFCGCEILEAKLHDEKEDGQRFLVYEIKALRPDGQILKLEMHARTGALLKVKRKGFAH